MLRYKKHWKAIALTPRLTVYVTTADQTVEQSGDREENSHVGIEWEAAHRRVALEALGNYVRSRGLRLVDPPHRIHSTPQDLHQLAPLREFRSAKSPYSITATVYEDLEECHGGRIERETERRAKSGSS
jgi:hypothetical protein